VTDLWTTRAAAAEQAVTRRYLHRLAGAPGTRIGRVRSPRPRKLTGSWNYWWQAHLLDCLVDAQIRDPRPRRAAAIAGMVRGVRLRNLGRWLNDYYDDIAWFGLAAHRAGPRSRPGPKAVRAITDRLRAGRTDDLGGGIVWRRGDPFKNAPANGPAAILLARTGDVETAMHLTDWLATTLVDANGLVMDGIRPDRTDPTTYTYCQGVYLGACIELAEQDGDPRWLERAERTLTAVATHLAEPDGVIGGYDDGGDGGLFNGILARYLADAAVRRPELPHARELVLASAESVWRNSAEGPFFAHDWRRPARRPGPDAPEGDLSVQLSGWMLLEAASRIHEARPVR
jgi:predicted alpha-1,6-mannanase (GH76 family)